MFLKVDHCLNKYRNHPCFETFSGDGVLTKQSLDVFGVNHAGILITVER